MKISTLPLLPPYDPHVYVHKNHQKGKVNHIIWYKRRTRVRKCIQYLSGLTSSIIQNINMKLMVCLSVSEMCIEKNIYSNDNSVLIIFVLFKTKDYTKRKKCNENIVIYVGNNLSEILNSGHATTISNISRCSRNLNGKSCFIYVLPVMIYLF